MHIVASSRYSAHFVLLCGIGHFVCVCFWDFFISYLLFVLVSFSPFFSTTATVVSYADLFTLCPFACCGFEGNSFDLVEFYTSWRYVARGVR